MRVLHILNELKPSGAEVMLGLAAPFWRALGCDLHILSMAKTRGVYADVLERAGWQIHLTNPEKATFSSTYGQARIVRKIQPDLVHIHSEGKSLPNSFAIRLSGIPVVRTIHNNFQFEGRLRQRKKLERLICRLLGVRHVAISKSVQSNELSRFSNPSQVCWNWFASSQFRPPTAAEKIAARQRLGLPGDRKVLVSIGNGSDVKNYSAIVEALAVPSLRSLLYCQVGLPHPGGVDQALAEKYQLQDSVRFCGSTDRVLDWLWACDLYMMPSTFEGLSLAAAEALAAGCNCVFANSPGLTDFEGFGVEVFWTEPTSAAVAEAIRCGIGSPLAEAVLQENAGRIRDFFAVEPRARAYYEVWMAARAIKS